MNVLHLLPPVPINCTASNDSIVLPQLQEDQWNSPKYMTTQF